MATRFFRFGAAVAALALGGCELAEVDIVDVEDVVVAEVYVDLAPDPTDSGVRALLHQTLGQSDPSLDDLEGAEVTITRTSDAFALTLVRGEMDECLESVAETPPGVCFVATDADAQQLRPGDVLELTVGLLGGGSISGAARVPGDFDLVGSTEACRIPPDTNVDLRWTSSEGAWAYLNETSIRGLPELLATEGIEMDDDPLYLLGLSISDADTTIAFPAEFGVFNRFDLQTDVATRLQRGVPAEATAEITVRAVDRNYVNWARGGNFNPSGQVRLPSLFGDGTGVFGATYGYSIQALVSGDGGTGLPDC